MPGLWTKFSELKQEYKVDTYAELVEAIEADSPTAQKMIELLSGRRGKISADAVYAALRARNLRTTKKTVTFILRLRKLYRLPAPGNILVGPWRDNPILTLLGTYGPLRRDHVAERINYVDYRDPMELLAAAHKSVLIKNGRGFDRRRIRIIEHSKGHFGGHEIILDVGPEKAPAELRRLIELKEKFRVPVISIDELIENDTVLVPHVF